MGLKSNRRIHFAKHLLLTILLSVGIIAHAQKPKGDRILSYQVTNSETETFDDAMQFAVDHCMEMVHLQFPWGNYEKDKDSFDQVAMELMDISEIYFPAWGLPLELNIATYNTTVNQIPADLQSLPYDDSLMIARFKNFLDTLFARIPSVKLKMLNIGNESDVFMGTNAVQYQQYKTFLDSVRPYAKQKYFALHGEDLSVGTTLTMHGLTGASQATLCKQLNSGLDIIAATYYPLITGFQMDVPKAVHTDFGKLVSQYPDTSKKIHMVECGYASSARCNSTEQKQAEFFTETFAAWDTFYHNIKSISIFKVADWSQAEVDTLGKFYGISDTAFLEYLRTLGLRSYVGMGTDKPAVEAIACALDARNWCSKVQCKSGIEEPEESAITLYPNPASTAISLSGLTETQNYTMYNHLGAVIRTGVAINQQVMDISDLAQGAYVMHLESGKVLRFVKD
jgi:hypothetical protein